MPEAQARVKIKADGFQPLVDHHSSRTTPRGLVFKQDPDRGRAAAEGEPGAHLGLDRAAEGGRPRPRRQAVDRCGCGADEAAAEARPAQRPVGEARGRGDGAGAEGRREAHGREPRAAERVEGAAAGRRARRWSGEPFDQAASELQAKGFKVQPRYVDDNQPANTVIGQSPSAGGTAGKGSVISLTVSKGPKTSTVPDVTSYDLASAQQQLQASGFKWQVTEQDVSDPNQVGTVLAQDPGRRRAGGAEDASCT